MSSATKALLYTLKFVTGQAPDGPVEWSPGLGFEFTQSSVEIGPDQDNLSLVGVAALGYVDTGYVSDSQFVIQRARGARIFNGPVRTAATGATVVWTPTTGLRFILLGGVISVAAAAAAATSLQINLLDGAGAFFGCNVFVPATTLSVDTVVPFDFGHGYRSQAVDNELSINLNTALTAGGVAISVWGIESI